MSGLEDRRGRVERVHRRVDPLLGDPAREHRGRVQVREHRCGRRIGEVVGGHVDGLHRGHRSTLGGGDPLLQLAHLGLQRRLVAHRRRHPAEQRRDLRAGLNEAEDVVDEEQHVLAARLAEVLGHRQPGERHPEAGARGLVHLTEDEHRLVDHPRLLHLEPEVVALARALADAAEGRQPLVLLGDVADQLLDQHRLADAGATEQADLAALGVGSEQVDDLDPRLQDLLRGGQILDLWGGPMDRPALLDLDGTLLVDRLSEQVEDPSHRCPADGHRDRPARCRRSASRGRGRRSSPSPARARGRRPGAAAPRRSAPARRGPCGPGSQCEARCISLGGRRRRSRRRPPRLPPRPGPRSRWSQHFRSCQAFLSLSKCLGPADHLEDLLRDLRLADPVRLQRQRADHVLGVLGRASHRGHPRTVLRSGRLQQRPVDR